MGGMLGPADIVSTGVIQNERGVEWNYWLCPLVEASVGFSNVDPGK